MALHRLHAQDRRQAGLPRTLISSPPTRIHPGRHQILHRRRNNSSSDNNWEVQIPLNHLRQVFSSVVSQKPARAKRAIRIPVGKRSAPCAKLPALGWPLLSPQHRTRSEGTSHKRSESGWSPGMSHWLTSHTQSVPDNATWVPRLRPLGSHSIQSSATECGIHHWTLTIGSPLCSSQWILFKPKSQYNTLTNTWATHHGKEDRSLTQEWSK